MTGTTVPVGPVFASFIVSVVPFVLSVLFGFFSNFIRVRFLSIFRDSGRDILGFEDGVAFRT